MDQLTINIAYTSENQEVVSRIVSELSQDNVFFNLVDGDTFNEVESFFEHLTTNDAPCLLMVSDNFLKSTNCLNKGLTYLQNLIKKEQIIPVILPGNFIDEEGNRQSIPTEFERVSNVIKYMNYWQECYLDLRKLKRSIPAEQEQEFNAKLKTVRTISSEVGEYLRTLRETNYYTLADFSANHYEAFFRNFGDEASYLSFINKAGQKIVQEDTEANIAPSTTGVLPIEQLIENKELVETLQVVEQNKTEVDDNLTTEDLSEEPLVPEKNVEEEKEVIEVENDTAIEIEKIIESPNLTELVELDPELEELMEEEEEEIESLTEEAETPLAEIAQTEERPLTDTELLALELAGKLPNNQESEEELESAPEEEEMISLDDLLGEDFSVSNGETAFAGVVAAGVVHQTLGNDSEEKEETIPEVEKEPLDLFSSTEEITLENEITEISSPEKIEEEEEEDEELEGYFMDEGEETEELEEEISEIEILQSANTLVQSGKVAEGISLLENTLKDAPDFVSVRYQYAAFLAKFQNDFKGASTQLATLLEQEPNNLSAKFFLGELAEAERDYLTAKNYYEKVHEENDEFPNVSYKLGMLMVNHIPEEKEKAVEYLEHAYELNANNLNALYQVGILQNESLGQPDKAIVAFEEVVEKAPEHPFANYDLALIYHKAGENEKAKAYYEKACQINPELKSEANDIAFKLIVEDTGTTEISLDDLNAEIEQKVDLELSGNALVGGTVLAAGVVAGGDEHSLDETADSIAKNIIAEEKQATKIVLITGATSGIGKATAIKFAQEGHQLILTGRRFSRLFQLKDQFEKAYNADVRLLPFDIRSADAVQAALAELEPEWQAIDLLINNAGMAKGATEIHKGNFEDWENMIDTNIKGLLYMTREIAPFMVKRREGQIINICSLAGKEVYPNNAVYCATKHAVDALTKAIRVDLHLSLIHI